MNLIVSFFLTDHKYPFWNYAEKPNIMRYSENWRKSLEKLDLTSVLFVDEEQPILSDLKNKNLTIRKVEKKGTNQVDCRWAILHDFLLLNKDIEFLFMTDLSDVTVLKNPFEVLVKGEVYVGDENCLFGENEWIMNRVKKTKSILCGLNSVAIKNKQLLNCGVFGGHRDTILPVIEKIAEKIEKYNVIDDTVDMIAVNEVLRLDFNGVLIHGKPITTEFWKWDFNNKECFFQHK